MSSWGEFAEAAPGLAAFGAKLGARYRIAYLATVRSDGAPRLHPFCPIVTDGRIFAAISVGSPKGDDLRRDGRYVIHWLPGEDDAEFSVRGRAVEVTDGKTRSLVESEIATWGSGGMLESVRRDPLFEFDIERADGAVWRNVGQPGTYAERDRWEA